MLYMSTNSRNTNKTDIFTRRAYASREAIDKEIYMYFKKGTGSVVVPH